MTSHPDFQISIAKRLSLADVLRFSREYGRMSVGELARRSGIPRVMLMRMERGRAKIDVVRAKPLPRILHIRPSMLRTGAR
jgi:transcriptional regulator with XRE-family HTH domain